MRIQKFRQIALIVAGLMVACGSGSDNDPTSGVAAQLPANSGVGHSHVTARVYGEANGVNYASRSEEDKIVAWFSADSVKIDLDLQGFYPDVLFVPEAWPNELWVFGHDSNGVFALRSLTDTTGDGMVDPSSSQVLLSGDRPDRLESLAFDASSGTLYLMESMTRHVCVAVDTTNDNRPDSLQGDPFLNAAWVDEPGVPLGSATRYGSIDDPVTGLPVTVPAGSMLFAIGLANAKADRVQVLGEDKWLIDTDGDHVVDTIEPIARVKAPAFAGYLVDGLRRVQLDGHEGSTLELVTDAGVVLGQAAPEGWVNLASPLAQGQTLKVVDNTNGLESEYATVGHSRIYANEPGVVTLGDAITVTITGANFDLVTSVVLQRKGASQTLTYQLISAQEIRVNLPAMGPEWDAHTEILMSPSAPFDRDEWDTYPDTVGVERCPH
jgi:hypothetical protein